MDLSRPTDSKDWVIIDNLRDIISELKQDLANAESKVTDDQDVTTIMQNDLIKCKTRLAESELEKEKIREEAILISEEHEELLDYVKDLESKVPKDDKK